MLGVCRRVVWGSLVPCLSHCWRGPTWAPFYKPVVPGAPAHTGVGKEASHQDMWRFFYDALSKVRVEVGGPETVTSMTSVYMHETWPHPQIAHDRKLKSSSSSVDCTMSNEGNLCAWRIVLVAHLPPVSYAFSQGVCVFVVRCVSGLDESTS